MVSLPLAIFLLVIPAKAGIKLFDGETKLLPSRNKEKGAGFRL